MQPLAAVTKRKSATCMEMPAIMERVMKVSSIVVSMVILAPATAMAGPAAMRQMNVPYADLNVASQKGAETLQHRIQAASRLVCGPRPDMRDLDNATRFDRCVTDSTRRAMADMRVVEHTALGEKAAVSVTVTR